MSASDPEPRTPVPYRLAQSAQRALVARRRAGDFPDLLWLLEHPLTLTFGTSGKDDHLLERAESLAARGVAIVRSERGGDVTCHEPGQLVGYPIVDLRGPGDRDLHEYLRRLEAGLLGYLDSVGVPGTRVPGRTGVWLDGNPRRKIAALGVRVQGWVTSHGFALNVENTLRGFELIVPCGIRDAAVTSLARELGGGVPSWEALCRGVHEALEEALRRPLRLVLGLEGLTLAGERPTASPDAPGGA